MVTHQPDSPARPLALAWWSGLKLLRQRSCALLVGSNALSSIGTAMQLLLQGWLVVSWGHSPFFLGIFAVARLAPKIVLTVPAGIVCDRIPRRTLLIAARLGYALASVIPLAGLIAPVPIAWLLAGVVLAGGIHAFDLSSARAMLGDLVPRDDLHPAVAVNRIGQQMAALLGPASAFLLISWAGTPVALAVSATLLGAGALAILPLPAIVHAVGDMRMASAGGGLYRYLKESPVAILLLLVGIVPAFIDKTVALLLPSVSGGSTATMALIAPELGALLMASVLAVAPVRFGGRALIGVAVCYALLICTASVRSQTAEMLIIALGLAGMASAAISTSAHAGLQVLVPADMRGRVFAI